MKFKSLATLSLAVSIAILPSAGQTFAAPQIDSNHRVDSSTEAKNVQKGELVVTMKPGKSLSGKELNQLGATVVDDHSNVVKTQLKVLKVGNVDAVLKALKNNPNVEYAEPNYTFNAAFTPDDTLYSDQYGPQNTSTPAAWDMTFGDSSQEIAVIDTGVYYDHPDLNDKTILGYDFAQNDNDPKDLNGHGTHVAGTAAAETNNATGVAGMAPETKVLAVRALGANGSGSLNDIADAIRYSADAGAEVINMSLGCDCDSQTLEDAVNYAWNSGSVVVAAAGNDGVSTTFEPASYENVIAVGAVDSNNEVAYFSNYGSWVDVTAPGVDIVSTVLRGKYDSYSGTSMASPHVAGLAGLLASQGRSNTEIRTAIEQTADPINGTGSYFEHGLINSYHAVNH
ncbi:S8 family peptidase [Halobacillus karajensis]|uniref:Thermophilic serine proteinase n=1 Tax=Halobacillus karajensis TaxID=195088 RepID=A0A024P7K8_9BACI|nr:S8 family peptidase [Halobacillus karajensis]CDQ20223.1 Thermophilic serine proteinase precursor [Halobacillus karajensis]CDQ25114.1 Thermophilic serine proteinase precursor [Halobacillus karajensis]CDQ28525.1 Thermophilic serine proteinase precursor [Halobacillus karajensis]